MLRGGRRCLCTCGGGKNLPGLRFWGGDAQKGGSLSFGAMRFLALPFWPVQLDCIKWLLGCSLSPENSRPPDGGKKGGWGALARPGRSEGPLVSPRGGGAPTSRARKTLLRKEGDRNDVEALASAPVGRATLAVWLWLPARCAVIRLALERKKRLLGGALS